MPDPIAMAILGRFVADRDWQRARLGAALLRDAVLRTAWAAAIMGIHDLFVHAISAEGNTFCKRNGFAGSQTHPMMPVVSIKVTSG